MIPKHAATGPNSIPPPNAGGSYDTVLIENISPVRRQRHKPLSLASSEAPPIFNEEAAFRRKGGYGLHANFTNKESDARVNTVDECFDISDKENIRNNVINVGEISTPLPHEAKRRDEHRKMKREERVKRETMNRIALQQKQIEQGRQNEQDLRTKRDEDGNRHVNMDVQRKEPLKVHRKDKEGNHIPIFLWFVFNRRSRNYPYDFTLNMARHISIQN